MAENESGISGDGKNNNQPTGITGPDEKKNTNQPMVSNKSEEKRKNLGPEYRVQLRRGGDLEKWVNGRQYRITTGRPVMVPEKDFLSKDFQNDLDVFIVVAPVKNVPLVGDGKVKK